MNLFVWVMAGAVVGWIGIAFLKFNVERGTLVSMIIGVTGGVVGGKLVAPMFLAVPAVPADFSSPALYFAIAVAAIFLTIGNLVYERLGL